MSNNDNKSNDELNDFMNQENELIDFDQFFIKKDDEKSKRQKNPKKEKNLNSVWDDYNFTKKEIQEMNEQINKYNNDKKRHRDPEAEKGTKKRKIDINKSEKNNDEKSENSMLGWVSATKTKNYLLSDQAVDWLSYYFDKYGIGEADLTEEEKEANQKLLKDASHLNILLEGGNIFERKVYNELKNIYGDDFVEVMTEEDMNVFREKRIIDGVLREKNKNVYDLMNKGTPIIAQAPLINDMNRTYGIADILIRSDYLEVMFNVFNPDKEITIKAPKLKMVNGLSYHYRVIDCKWTTMVLSVDGATIRNNGYFPAYKGQLAVYTAALGILQGYTPNYAYIMAKAWKIGKTNIDPSEEHLYKGYSAFDRLGIIDYKGKDRRFLSATKESIKWMQSVMTTGREWRYGETAPSVPEMYPNMNKNINPVFDKVKNKLAVRYGDPTMVWFVGTKNREIAHQNGIYDIRDPECTLDKLGIKQSARGDVIEKIIEINRNGQEKIIDPKIIKNNICEWQTEHVLDYYVDFETINYNLYVDPNDLSVDNSYFDSDVSFMIGFGFTYNSKICSKIIIDALEIDTTKCNYYNSIDHEKGWEFVCLYLSKFDLKNEMEMFRIFFQFIIVREMIAETVYNKKNNSLNSKMFHWTEAEIRFLRRAMNRMRSGDYTKFYMENRKLNFMNNNGEEITEHDVQCELNNMINTFNKKVIWIDMCKIFEKEPIVIKGSYRFKLKHIGNAFYKNGFIDTKWDDGAMSDGFRAMLEAIKLYRSGDVMSVEHHLYKDIILYNEVDCRVIWEIVRYLRANHSAKN